MRPFEGIRIIDASHVLAAPFATYQLAVLGAEVIKVGHPVDVDQSRTSGSDSALNKRGMGTQYLTQNANKRSITLDLKHNDGRAILRRLVATADVLVVPETASAKIVAGLNLAFFNATEEVQRSAELSALEAEFSRILQRRM